MDQRQEGGQTEGLAELQQILDRIYGKSGMLDAPSLALQDTVRRYAIPKEYFQDLLRGISWDLTKARYEDFAELEKYCYCVASVVGLMMCHVFGVTDPLAKDHATMMGTAMQLTNILRDVGEDFRLGRIYIPREDLETFGYTEGDLAAQRVDRRFTELMIYQIARARGYYRKAAPGIESIPDDGSRLCVRLMSSTYSAILDRIEANSYDVFSNRASVSLAGKLKIVGSILFDRQAAAGGRVRHSGGPSNTSEPKESGAQPVTGGLR